MMGHILKILVVLMTLNTIACSSAKFNVKSDPLDAEVFVENSKTGEKKTLGRTPLEIPMSMVKETLGEEILAGEFFNVVVEKKGYISQKLNVPASRFGTSMVAIDVAMKAGDEQKQLKLASEVLDHLFTAQTFAMAKEYERAQIELDKILQVAPSFVRAITMRASIYFVQKNYIDSLKWYESALVIDPKMEEAIKMVSRIKAIPGFQNASERTPASPDASKSAPASAPAAVPATTGGAKP